MQNYKMVVSDGWVDQDVSKMLFFLFIHLLLSVLGIMIHFAEPGRVFLLGRTRKGYNGEQEESENLKLSKELYPFQYD